MGNREDKYAVTVTMTRAGETRNLGVFDTFEGGGSEADSTKYGRGGMQPHDSLGGRRVVDDITCSRLYDDFMQAQEPWIDGGVGRAECVVTKQPLDDEGIAFGKPRIYTGKLQGWTAPDHDSQGSGEGVCEITVAPRGPIG